MKERATEPTDINTSGPILSLEVPRALFWQQHVAGLHCFLEWQWLVEAEVAIHLDGAYVRSGKVDAATPDGTIIWLVADGAYGRRLFEKTAGFQAWLSTAELQRIARLMQCMPASQ